MTEFNQADYTEGFENGTDDCEMFGVNYATQILNMMVAMTHGEHSDYSIGYSTAINVRKERVAR